MRHDSISRNAEFGIVLKEVGLIFWFGLVCRGAGFQQNEKSDQESDLYAIHK
jgi:hypothetical protein